MEAQGAQTMPEHRIHYSDGMTKSEIDGLFAQYRKEGWKSISISERKHLAEGSGFKTAHVVMLSRKA